MTALLPVPDARAGRDRLEVLTALISAPSFDPLFRAEIIKIPAGHPVYRWNCLVTGCERPTMGHGDLCRLTGAVAQAPRRRRDAGWLPAGRGAGRAWRGTQSSRAGSARSVRPATSPCGCVTTTSSAGIGYRDQHGDGADFGRWLAGQEPAPGYGCCRVRVCPETGELAAGAVRPARGALPPQGSPGGAALPSQWGSRYERPGRAVPVGYADEAAFRRWCATAARCCGRRRSTCAGLHPLLRAEIQWGMSAHARQAARAVGTGSGCSGWRTTAASAACAR